MSLSEIGAILVFGLLAGWIFFLGWRKGFFSQGFSFGPPWSVPLRFFHVLGVFAIYFLTAYCTSIFFVSLNKSQFFSGVLPLAVWFNFTNSLAILLLLGLFLRRLPPAVRKGVWRAQERKPSPFRKTLIAALWAWAIAFPLVLFASQLLETAVAVLFSVRQLPDQLAVKFLKMTFEHPGYLFLSTVSIAVFAPLIEETLFRGFLQSFIRQHLGSKHAICIASACFSFFHFSSEQGLSNIPIIGALFILAFFLGYLYEKEKSLLAPILLHATFNTVSMLNIYLFGGFAGGI